MLVTYALLVTMLVTGPDGVGRAVAYVAQAGLSTQRECAAWRDVYRESFRRSGSGARVECVRQTEWEIVR